MTTTTTTIEVIEITTGKTLKTAKNPTASANIYNGLTMNQVLMGCDGIEATAQTDAGTRFTYRSRPNRFADELLIYVYEY